MSGTHFINLTYSSPHEDIEKLSGLNSDGTTNVNFTLLSMKELLSRNLEVINNLITEANNITEITPIGYGIIEIKMKSLEIMKKMIDADVIITKPPHTDDYGDDDFSDTGTENFQIDEDNIETNQQRLRMINNLINQSDLQNIFGDNSGNDSDSESNSESDELINDDKNINLILNKYSRILNNNKYMPNISDSSQSDSDSQVNN
jgi:hypothetical protein